MVWDIPPKGLQAYVSRLKQIQAQERERERNKPQIDLKRVRVELYMPQEEQATDQAVRCDIINAQVILNDISSVGMHLFSESPLALGQILEAVIVDPIETQVYCQVVSCKNILAGSRVFSSNPFPYRVTMRFYFAFPEEQVAFKKYCDDLAMNYLGRRA